MKHFLILFVLIGGGSAFARAQESFYPVQEWEPSKAAVMGGISDCGKIAPYYGQYLKYVEALSKAVPVTYFTNSTCQAYIKEQIDTSNIRFLDYSLNSIWIRDYAPIWLKDQKTGSFVLANFPYGANYFGKREQDDQFSSFLSKALQIPLVLDFPRKQIQFYFDGGNLMVDEESYCYTALRNGDGLLPESRINLLKQINCKGIIFMTPIPQEPTGHIDTFMKFLPGKRALLARYTSSPFKEAMEANKKELSDRGFQVIEVDHIDLKDYTSWSYLNSVIVGSNAFVPQYGFDTDAAAVTTFQRLGFAVHPIKADQIMRERGSLHCITNFVY